MKEKFRKKEKKLISYIVIFVQKKRVRYSHLQPIYYIPI